jgi:hypothetical protein
VVIAHPDVHLAERAVRMVRRERADVPVIVRVVDDSAIDKLKQAGATEVIPEVLEGSLTIVAETLAPTRRASRARHATRVCAVRRRALRLAVAPPLRRRRRCWCRSDPPAAIVMTVRRPTPAHDTTTRSATCRVMKLKQSTS